MKVRKIKKTLGFRRSYNFWKWQAGIVIQFRRENQQ